MGNLFCGIDFHKRTSTIFVCNEDGRQVGQTKRVDSTRLLQELRNIRGQLVVGIECSGGVNHQIRVLRSEGFDARIINANKSRAIGYGGKKTDAKDAETIAHLLRTNFAPEVELRSQTSRNMSMMITAREHLVTTRTAHVCHIRGLLREYGITIPAGIDTFLNECKTSLGHLEKQNPHLARILGETFAEVERLKRREMEINREIEEATKEDDRISRLRDIPGLGLLGAFMMLAVVDDIARFPNAKTFASYLGLVPREDSSGDKRRLGSVTKAGNETLRRYLIHGARAVLKSKNFKDHPLYEWAIRIEKKRGTNKATVALAHKLARISFALLRDGSSYSKHGKLASKEAA